MRPRPGRCQWTGARPARNTQIPDSRRSTRMRRDAARSRRAARARESHLDSCSVPYRRPIASCRTNVQHICRG